MTCQSSVFRISIWLTMVSLLACSHRQDNSRSSSRHSNSASDTLATLAKNRGFYFGTFFFDPANTFQRQPATSEFNLYTLPVFIDQVWPTKDGSFDWKYVKQVADFAPSDVAFKIPGLIWCGHIPKAHWLKTGTYTGAEIRAFMNKYLEGVFHFIQSNYPNRKIIAWDIVNEPISFSPTSDSCVWHKIGLEDENPATTGYHYIDLAFNKARELAPKAKLYLNNFGAEGLGTWSDRMFHLVHSLKAKGIPIDGVGLQSHFMVRSGGPMPALPACAVDPLRPLCFPLFSEVPSLEELSQNLSRISSIGLETMLTEVDISIREGDIDRKTLEKQADGFRTLLRACLKNLSCKSFSTWGVGDNDSWIPKFFPGWGHPLIFDEGYKRKSTIYATVRAELMDK